MVTDLLGKHDAMEQEMSEKKTAMEDARQQLQRAIAVEEAATQDHNHFKDVLAAHRSDLETQRAHAVALVSRVEHIGALSQCAVERTAAREASWRKWEDRLGASDALSTFNDADLAPLLILLGRCGWIEAFKQHGLTAGMLQTVTVAELKLVRGTCRLLLLPCSFRSVSSSASSTSISSCSEGERGGGRGRRNRGEVFVAVGTALACIKEHVRT